MRASACAAHSQRRANVRAEPRRRARGLCALTPSGRRRRALDPTAERGYQPAATRMLITGCECRTVRRSHASQRIVLFVKQSVLELTTIPNENKKKKRANNNSLCAFLSSLYRFISSGCAHGKQNKRTLGHARTHTDARALARPAAALGAHSAYVWHNNERSRSMIEDVH